MSGGILGPTFMWASNLEALIPLKIPTLKWVQFKIPLIYLPKKKKSESKFKVAFDIAIKKE